MRNMRLAQISRIVAIVAGAFASLFTLAQFREHCQVKNRAMTECVLHAVGFAPASRPVKTQSCPSNQMLC